MTQENYFNDAPINTPEDDKFGIDPFASALANSIKNIEAPIGAVVGLNGKWGSGKSSAVNLIRYHLEEKVKSKELEIIDFNCWWFQGEEALTLAFLQELNSALVKSFGKKTKELISNIGKKLLQARPVIGPAVNIASGGLLGGITSGSLDFAKKFFDDSSGIQKLFQQLSEILEKQDKRFLVVIDDIDRLTPDEALLVFRLVKSVGRLPNLIYLLIFDRELAEKSVKEKYPSEGPHFLETIIQASFEVPLPPRDYLNSAVLAEVERMCGALAEQEQVLRFMNIFYDAISPYMQSPRDLVRLSNALTISWPAVAGEVDIADFVALEVMRLFEPKLYNTIRMNRDKVCGTRANYTEPEKPEEKIELFLSCVNEDGRERAKSAIVRLFPRFEKVIYSGSSLERWQSLRLACAEEHFDSYFRLAIGDETISFNVINEFIEKCGDKKFVKGAFIKARETIRRNGRSQVPLLLEELNIHASRIEKEKFQPLISALFEIADDIDRPEDAEQAFSFGDNQLRIHWLIRKLTFERCSLEERTKLFLMACQNAQLGWLVNFTSSAIEDHFSREGKEPEPDENCLITKDRTDELKSLAVNAIIAVSETDDLIAHPQLPYIAFRWLDFTEDGGAAVKAWTESRLADDITVAHLAKAFTNEGWTQSLGDKVAMKKIEASVKGLDAILDLEKFRQRLEQIEKEDKLENPYKEYVQIFLDSWRKQDRGGNWLR